VNPTYDFRSQVAVLTGAGPGIGGAPSWTGLHRPRPRAAAYQQRQAGTSAEASAAAV